MAFSHAQTQADVSTPSPLVGRVFGLLAFGMAFTAVGAFIAPRLSAQALSIGGIGALVTWAILFFARGLPPMARLAVFYIFCVCQGLALGSVISRYVAAGQGNIVVTAAIVTAGVTLALGGYAWTTKRSFAGWGRYLFLGLIGVLIASLVGFFVRAPLFHLALAWVTAIVFGGYLLHHVQRLRTTRGDAISLAISIYLDILNLFWAIFRIVNATQRRR